MRAPKVSVVIPVYNGENTLKQCLNSVLNQTYDNYEVIVVNNNSTDDSESIIRKFERKNSKIIYAFEQKKGRGSARNKGIKLSQEGIIAMTDSDCIVPNNWLENLIKPIINENETATMGSEEDLIKTYWTKNMQKLNQEFIKRNLKGKYIKHIDTKNFAIKASLIKEMLFNPNLNNLEDYELFIRLKKRGKIRFIPTLKVNHYHKSSFIGTVRVNFDRAYWATKIYKKYKADLSKKNDAMTVSISLTNFLIFPIWMIIQFIKKPIGEAYFLLISELSWRIGIIWGSIK